MATTNVAQRNVEIARKAYKAFNEIDMDNVMEAVAKDCVWHVIGDGPLKGDYKGIDAVLGFFMRFGQLTEGTYKADVHDILATDAHTVLMGTTTATRKGKTMTNKFVDVIHPNEAGQAKEFWRFVDDQAALDEWSRD
jgi:ketosteroid isomerase-like protein